MLGVLWAATPALTFAATYYVDNTCTVSGDGSAQTCAATVGDPGAFSSLSAAMNKPGGFTGGDSLLLKRGEVFREQLVMPSSGTVGSPVTVSSYGSGNKPLILGSDQVTAWTLSAGAVYVTPLLWNPNMVFVDDVPLVKVTTKTAMKAGTFYVDTTAKQLYVWLLKNASPVGRVVEVSRRPDMYYGLVQDGWTGNANIVFDGLEIKNSNWMSLRIFGGQNITVKNLTISNSFYNAIIAMGTGQGAASNPDNLVVSDSSIRNSGVARSVGYDGAAGISVDGSNTFAVLRNTVDMNYGEGIETYNTAQNGEIAYNLVSNQQLSGAIYVNGAHGNTTQNISVHHNRILNATSTAAVALIVANEGSGTIKNVHVFGNVISGYAGGGGLVVGSGSGTITSNKFYNNTISGTLHGIELIGTPTLSLTANEFKNNIVSLNSNGYTVLATANVSPGNVFDYNLYYNPKLASPFYWLGKLYTFAAFKTASAQEAHGKYAAPAFVTTPSTEFSLQASSGAINAGVNLGALFQTALMPNAVWPAVATTSQTAQGSAWEIGAYAYPVVSCTYASNTGASRSVVGTTQSACSSACISTRNSVFGVGDSGICTFRGLLGKNTVTNVPAVMCIYASNSGATRQIAVNASSTAATCSASCASVRTSVFGANDHGVCTFFGFKGEQTSVAM